MCAGRRLLFHSDQVQFLMSFCVEINFHLSERSHLIGTVSSKSKSTSPVVRSLSLFPSPFHPCSDRALTQNRYAWYYRCSAARIWMFKNISNITLHGKNVRWVDKCSRKRQYSKHTVCHTQTGFSCGAIRMHASPFAWHPRTLLTATAAGAAKYWLRNYYEWNGDRSAGA